jgi:hypothetical protein
VEVIIINLLIVQTINLSAYHANITAINANQPIKHIVFNVILPKTISWSTIAVLAV